MTGTLSLDFTSTNKEIVTKQCYSSHHFVSGLLGKKAKVEKANGVAAQYSI